MSARVIPQDGLCSGARPKMSALRFRCSGAKGFPTFPNWKL